MASSKVLNDFIGDVTECSICTEVIKDSKVLPCIHTFCLKCLEQYWKDEQPGNRVSCPLCRMEFDIPAGGLAGFPKNFSVEKLLDAPNVLSNMNMSNMTCDICSRLRSENDEAMISPVEKRCLDCQQNLCSHCAGMHLVTKGLELHRVKIIGELPETKDSTSHTGKPCAQHKDKKIEIYCLDCKTAVCMACFIIKHNGHKCSDINEVADDLKKQIKNDVTESEKSLQEVNHQSEKLEEILSSFIANVRETETEILQRGEEIKQLVDKHVQAVLKELKTQESSRLKELANAREELLVQRISFESFIKYSHTLIEKADPSDIASSTAQLKARIEILRKLRITQIGEPVKVSFTPSNLETFRGHPSSTTRNIIGECSISGGSFDSLPNPISFNEDTSLLQTVTISNVSNVYGVTVSEKEIFVVCQSSSEVKGFDCDTFKFRRTIPVPGLNNPWDITFSDNALFVGERTYKLIHRVPLNSTESISNWSVDGIYLGLSTTKSNNILVTCYSTNKLMEYTTTGTLVREIPLKDGITYPMHAIQLDNDRFLVCHVDNLHRVCLIDNKGQLIKSYGGAQGSGPVQLSYPYHLVADVNGFCLVVEHGGANRVVMLNNELKFVKELIPTSIGLNYPVRLCPDKKLKRLYVADYYNARVCVFSVLS